MRVVLAVSALIATCRAVDVVLPPVDPIEAPPPEPPPPTLPPLPALAPAGPLTGLIVVLSPGHGRLVQRSEDTRQRPLTWDWQRDTRHGLREDEWTAALCADELTPALEALGATVIPLRQPDRHADGLRVDDRGSAFTPGLGAALRDEDTLLAAPPGGEAWSTWRVVAPSAGAWRLTTRWTADPGHDRSATYVVASSASQRRVDVDQTRHGGAWWPLATLTLAAGEEVVVTLRTDGVASADGVQLGGGTFAPFVPELGGLAPAPWFEVAAVHQLPQLGGPESLLRLDDGNLISDMRFRARWTSWLTAPDDDVVFVSLHTNAGGGRGTMLFYGVDSDTSPSTPARAADIALAGQLHLALKQRLPEAAPGWRVNAPRPGNYSEISPFWNDAPGVILEAGFHTRAEEARRLTDPTFRAALVTAVSEGITAWRSDPASRR
jgi:N-acetylmuramoyl-L-alanine amidase